MTDGRRSLQKMKKKKIADKKKAARQPRTKLAPRPKTRAKAAPAARQKRTRPGRATAVKSKSKKSELHSLNAKLTRINVQLHEKMAQLAGTTRDLNSLLSSTDIAIVFLDARLRVRRFTLAVDDLLQLSPSDLGRPLDKLAHKFTDPALLTDARSVLQQSEALEAEIISESGRVYLRRALPHRTADQKINGVVLTFIDITRLKLAETALRTSEERLRLILEGVADYAILILDENGRFVTWSRSAERIFGFTANDTLGRSLEMLYPDEARQSGALGKELHKAKEQKSTPEERWHVRKDGARFWGAGVFSALYDEHGRMYGFVKILRDDTARKTTEEALQKAKSDAEAANASKDHFLANISHELRTPLSATLLWAKLLGMQQPVPPDQLKEGLEAIEKSAKEQQALIEDLVDTSRMVAGKLRLEFKEVSLPDLAEHGLELVRPLAVEKGVHLDADVDGRLGTVRADGLRLRQVLGNLLTNAVKFTPTGGRVTLAMEREGDRVQIRVTDTGQGISPEFLPRIFDRFTQAEPSGIRLTSGLGLGLSIAKQLVELHGGKISVASGGLAKGSTFTVHLPLPKITPIRPSAAALMPGRATPSLRGLHLLLVEDDVETRRALQAVLTEAGARVSAVDTVQLALKDFNRRRPDLILSDIGLGKVSGHEFIRQIRQWEKAQKATPVPALALTAYADERNRVEALESGFHQILIKPVDGPALISTLLHLHAAK